MKITSEKRNFLIRITMVALGLLFAGLIWFFAANNLRPFFVATPSMGTTAPVGSLALTKSQDDYKVNDIIAFSRGDRIYFHRILGREGEKFLTKGDLNDTIDNWRVAKKDIIGKSVQIVRHAGWLWRAAPWLILGFALVYIFSLAKFVQKVWRPAFRIMGFSIVVSLVTVWLHPWLNCGLLGYVPSPKSGVDMRIVNTGIFTIRGNDSEKIAPGEAAMINIPEPSPDGWYVLVPRPALTPPQIVGAIIFCLLPFLLAMVVKLPNPEQKIRENSKKERKLLYQGMVFMGVIVVLLLVLEVAAMGAFTAKITNSANSARSLKYATCGDAMSAQSAPQPLFAYAMNTTSSSYTINDISGNNLDGRYYGKNVSASGLASSFGCQRDAILKSTNFANNFCLSNREVYRSPNTFSLEIWFSTTERGTNQGKLVTFANTHLPAADVNRDRQIYIDKDGRVVFGVWSGGAAKIVASPEGKNYADGAWHHAVATMGADDMKLYLDGVLAAAGATTGADNYNGVWKFGCGTFGDWINADGTALKGKSYFSGNLQFGAVYGVVLSDVDVLDHYYAGAQL